MKVLMVHIGPIKNYPPALSTIQHLNDLGHNLILLSTDIDVNTKKLCDERNIEYININAKYEKPISPLLRLKRFIFVKHQLWKNITKIYDEETLIWVFSDSALGHLGKKLLNKMYVLHMFELTEEIIFSLKIPQIKMSIDKYAKNALTVIQAEYNRAHIAKAWWELEKLPYIIPNKPYDRISINKKSKILDKTAFNIINKIKDKKIILYQGVISKERPLEPFIEAINELGDEYAFVVMSNGENIYKGLDSKNFYFIPFVASPNHLQITSNAYIGVLSYVPTENAYSPLNALYCAPNKIYEYSMFGIPMIGNDVPGLKYLFDTKQCGVCFKSFEKNDIINTIIDIEEDYNNISKASEDFYDEIDIKEILTDIIINIDSNKKF